MKSEAMSGDALFHWRESRGLYQREAAALAGVSRPTWALYETGARPIPRWLMAYLREREQEPPVVRRADMTRHRAT